MLKNLRQQTNPAVKTRRFRKRNWVAFMENCTWCMEPKYYNGTCVS